MGASKVCVRRRCRLDGWTEELDLPVVGAVPVVAAVAVAAAAAAAAAVAEELMDVVEGMD